MANDRSLSSGSSGRPAQSRLRWLKTLVEWVLGLVAAGLVLPIVGAAAVALALTDGLPVLYVQQRIGRGGRAFRLLKIRSMKRNSLTVTEMGQVTSDHHLVTRLGRILRRTKVDELPQLVNVLKLEMALVGPRPTVLEHVQRYDAFQRRRLEVRPGLTGWAQVNGNATLTWEERIMLDVWYVDHWSLLLDARIIVKTVGVIFRGERRKERAIQEARDYALRVAGSR